MHIQVCSLIVFAKALSPSHLFNILLSNDMKQGLRHGYLREQQCFVILSSFTGWNAQNPISRRFELELHTLQALCFLIILSSVKIQPFTVLWFFIIIKLRQLWLMMHFYITQMSDRVKRSVTTLGQQRGSYNILTALLSDVFGINL